MSDLLHCARSLREAVEAAHASLERSYEAIDAATIAWCARGVLEALRGDPALWAELQRRLTFWHRAGADLARGFDDGQAPADWPDGAPWPPRPRSGAEWRGILEWLDITTRLGCDDTGGLRDRIRTALDRADDLGVEGLTWLSDPDLERDLGERLLAPEIVGRLLEAAAVIETGRLGADEKKKRNAGKGDKTKRSTEKGEARTKLIAALTLHHQYAEGGCLNYAPIGCNELARLADVSPSTASSFFVTVFGSHVNYKRACGHGQTVCAKLLVLNGDCAAIATFGRTPPGEGWDEGEDDE